jgi:hypothetical protein
MGAEAASDVAVTILLAIFTAGVGAAANIAAKSGRPVKVAKMLEKLAGALKRIKSFRRLPKKQKKIGKGRAARRAKSNTSRKGPHQPRTPEKKPDVDANKKKSYSDNKDGPKTAEVNDAALSKAPKDMFTEGADGKPGQNIKPKHLHRELRKSEIGRETLDIIERQNIDVVLSNQKPLFEKPGYKTYGVSYDDTAVAYLSNTQSKTKTAQTVIHEVTHCAGVKGTQRAEIIAEMRALKHVKEKPSYSDVKGIIKRVTRDYPELPYK